MLIKFLIQVLHGRRQFVLKSVRLIPTNGRNSYPMFYFFKIYGKNSWLIIRGRYEWWQIGMAFMVKGEMCVTIKITIINLNLEFLFNLAYNN